jgi:exodeoxyribonuclease V gamma subunit
MHVHRSNRIEVLIDRLAQLVAQPVGSAAAAECIVVQGKGMERWVALELAQRLGVWANPDFPFPRKLLERAFAAVLGPENAPSPYFEPETMLWAIADLLPALLDHAAFAPIRMYLRDDERAIKRMQLAERIATTFDQYVVYRPQLVLAWERGEDPDWQAVLWRALVERHGSTHVAARAAEFLAAVLDHRAPIRRFPARVSLFSISTLPPLYVQVLLALSPLVDVHLFVLSPSRQYWADIRSQREVLRTARNHHSGADPDIAMHLEEGHPLLASLGRVGREFQQVLEAAGNYVEDDTDLYGDPGTQTMLAALQSDILHLVHRGRADLAPALPLAPHDDSIAVHACHSPMREVEVLHDQLLALLDASPDLQPQDVVVMTPAVETYAPFIEAVFGGERRGRPRIPFHIADRRPRATDEVADAFARLLEALRGRLTASTVLDLLAIDTIRNRFGMAAEELELVRTWVTESGIRWGADAAHRAAVEQPAIETNTWRFGLDRLLLGYAMPGENRTLYAGVLPYDDVEGTASELLGRLLDFCTGLFSFRESLQAPRALDAWRDALGSLLETMVARTNATAYPHQRIRSALTALAERARTAGFTEAVDLDTVRAQLEQELERQAAPHGFLSGGVTFCALVPMRTIPFRVVCLLGMNDDAFPRTRRPLGFDLIAPAPQPGDRSPRDDDRYLFLESLLSARERLLITYVGQSINDNTDLPPSVVVSELLDALAESFHIAPTAEIAEDTQRAVHDRLVLRHPLQPFSPRYFGADEDPRLFSYARSYCESAQSLAGSRCPLSPFLSGPLPFGDAERAVSLDQLLRFFDHPVRTFLQRRLELYLGDDVDLIEDREPITLNALQQWKIGDALLARAIDGEDLAAAFDSVRAGGMLPLGVPGECTYRDLRPQIEALAAIARRMINQRRLPVVEIDAEIDGTRVTGALADVWPGGLVRWQYSKLGGRHELGLWIRHLLLNWLTPPGYPRVSYLVGRPRDDGAAIVQFRPVEDPQAFLRELIQLYWIGQTVPVPLFRESSRAYADILYAGGTEARALSAARNKWHTNNQGFGDCEDAYVQQVFGARDPTAADFRMFASGDPSADVSNGAPSNPLKAEGPFDELRVSGRGPLKPSSGSDHAEPVEARGGVFRRAASFHHVAQLVLGPMLRHREAGR